MTQLRRFVSARSYVRAQWQAKNCVLISSFSPALLLPCSRKCISPGNGAIITPSMEKTPRQGSWQIWVGMLVGVACLAAVFIFFAKPGEIIESLRHVQISYLLLGASGVVLFLVVRAVRWRFMMGNAPPYAPVLHIQNIGYLVNNFLPLRLGDDVRVFGPGLRLEPGRHLRQPERQLQPEIHAFLVGDLEIAR